MAGKKRFAKNRVNRLVFVLLSMALQAAWIVLMVWILQKNSTFFSVAIKTATVIAALRLYWQQTNAAKKMPWMILILAFPVLGLSLYFLMGRSGLTKKKRQRFSEIDAVLLKELSQDPAAGEELQREDAAAANLAEYIRKYSSYPMYRDTEITFFDDAAKEFYRQEEALRRAKRFIFMEYYAIEDSRSFQEIKKILFEKAERGVEIRIIYDDLGCISYIGREFCRELELAAKCGVDVRIITPGIPDKKIIYQVTRSYYRKLLESEVRIFEYTPGFCHGKQCVCDDRMAVVGSMNLDYRSLYLHFEDGVFFSGCRAVGDVKKDFDETFALCREIKEMKQPFWEGLWRGILRLFAPLM